jgi:hypothetical protein
VRFLTAIVTAVTVLAFGASFVAACDGMKGEQTAKKDGSVYYPPAESS